MSEFSSVLMGAILINNVMLLQLLGVSAFLKIARTPSASIGMAIATTIAVTLTSMVNHIIDHWVLIPLQLSYLRTLTFVLVISTLAQSATQFVEARRPPLYLALTGLMPFLASNTLILAVALQNSAADLSFIHSTLAGLAAGLGYALVLVLFAAVCERLVAADVPRPFQGAAITLISAGLMSMAFMGLSGIV